MVYLNYAILNAYEMYYFETINILSIFQDMLKIKFKLFTIYFNIFNYVKLYFFTIHLKYLVPLYIRRP